MWIRSPPAIKRAAGQIKAGQEREAGVWAVCLGLLSDSTRCRRVEAPDRGIREAGASSIQHWELVWCVQLERKESAAKEIQQEHSFQIELLEKSRETAVSALLSSGTMFLS